MDIYCNYTEYIAYNKKKYKFYDKIYKILDYDTKLEDIHNVLNTDKVNEESKLFYSDISELGKTDRNSLFVKKFYQKYDENEYFFELYKSFIIQEILPLFPLEENLVIQKTPNIRFHLPNNSNLGRYKNDPSDEIIGLHNDNEFGHPKEEINIIIPITEMFDTNSIYFESFPYSNKYESLKLTQNQFFMGYFNQCRHFNTVNKTNNTRVSFDFRIIPYSLYKDNNNFSITSKTKFNLDNYYTLLMPIQK